MWPTLSRSAVAMLAMAVLSGVLDLASTSARADQLELRILTFNVWHGLRSGEARKRFPGEQDARRERRLALQIEALRRLDADVLLLQEVNPNQRLARRYARELGYDEIHKVTSCGVHLGVLYKIPRNVNDGLAILARPGLDLRPMGHARLSGNARCAASWGFQTRESRYALFGAIRAAGRDVLLATAHLSAPPFVPEGFAARLTELVGQDRLTVNQEHEIAGVLEVARERNHGEAQSLLAQIDRRLERMARGDNTPVVLGGDLNSLPDEASVRALESSGYRNAGRGPGFHTWDPVTNRLNCEIASQRSVPVPTFGLAEIEELLAARSSTPRQIDYVFTSGIQGPVDAERVLDKPVEGLYLSDHFGILVTVRLDGDRAP